MRKQLAPDEGQRKKFNATFSRFGKKVNYKGYSEITLLLTHVTDAETNTLVADHLWFSYTSGFEKAGLTEGCRIEFEARVKQYRKGYVNKRYGINSRKQDYKLSNPGRIKAVKHL
jgi:hypothetical protein